MCGIIGYIGLKPANEVIFDGLTKLEYRGYDSAGIAVRLHDDGINVIKAIGKLNNLIEKVNGMDIKSNFGIGHTRWSTHGAVYYSLSESKVYIS